jgi:hypothetical protein
MDLGDRAADFRAGPRPGRAGYRRIAPTIRKIKHDTALLIAVLGLQNPA